MNSLHFNDVLVDIVHLLRNINDQLRIYENDQLNRTNEENQAALFILFPVEMTLSIGRRILATFFLVKLAVVFWSLHRGLEGDWIRAGTSPGSEYTKGR